MRFDWAGDAVARLLRERGYVEHRSYWHAPRLAGWSGGWRFVTLAAGAVETDDRGRPVKKQRASEPAAAPAAVSIEAAKEADIAKRVAAIAASTAYRAIGREDLAEAIAPGDFKPSIAPASTQQAAAADSSGAADPAAADDRAWGQYLYHGHNPKGLYLERWRHAAGCRRWFNVARDTVSHEIVEVYAAGALPRDAAARAVHAANWRRAEEDG